MTTNNNQKEWAKVLPLSLEFSVLTKTLPSKGNLAYEYNPFRNYRLTKDMYEYLDTLYSESALKSKFGIVFNTETVLWEDLQGNVWPENDLPSTRLKGELVDFITDELNFNLENPVLIIPQYSYDGSVNLILNDGINLPRIINSRFSATGKDTYEIVDRTGGNDTNIYDQGELFETDISLYKRIKTIPKLKLKSISYGGLLYCGNYHFYFKLADADGNETDFVAESGLVSLFIGSGDPVAIYAGNKNENTYKKVNFLLSNLDPSYSYVYVYYSRATAEDGTSKIIEYKRIDKKYLINNLKISNILITGYEESDSVSLSDINLTYNVVDSAKCAATVKNMLFLGNVHKPTEDVDTLTDLSLRFLPYLKDSNYPITMNLNYSISSTSKGYYDPVFIYNYVGYWDLDLYRLGIVYILGNGTLSSVYNIRGRLNLATFNTPTSGEFALNSIKTVNDGSYNHYFQYKKSGTLVTEERVKIRTSESTNYLIAPETGEGYTSNSALANYENAKGVVSLNTTNDTNTIHAFEIRVEETTVQSLKDLGILGFFFVRLGRIPLTLTQGITVGLDNISRTPTIPTLGGILDTLASDLKKGTSYVETLGINKTNYISEGFLSRFLFELKLTSSGIWKKIGNAMLMAAAVAAITVASVFTAGAASAIAMPFASALGSLAASIGGSFLVSTTIVGVMATAGAAVAAAAVVGATMTAIAASEELITAITRTPSAIELKGRNSTIPSGYYRSEIDDSRILGEPFKKRIIIKDYTKNTVSGILCPDYDVAPQVYNQYFTGNEFTIITSKSLAVSLKFIDYYAELEHYEVGYYFTNNSRHFYIPMNAYASSTQTTYTSKIQAVPDDTSLVTIGATKFRSKAGSSEEAWRYLCVGTDYSDELSSNAEDDEGDEPTYKETNSDIIRGSFGPYLGMSGYSGCVGLTVSIMVPGYSTNTIESYVLICMQDNSTYSAISDRISLQDLEEYYQNNSGLAGDSSRDLSCIFTLYRGDCYICQFTHRVIRNFNDPTAPYNDTVVDSESWKSNYKVKDSSKFEKINLGDVNAVKLGMWVTFSVRSNRNLNIRSLDSSSTEECAKMGHAKGFFPYQGMQESGIYKSSEALVYNDGYTLNLSSRTNFVLPSSPYNLNWYGTRIMYSDTQINNGISNGFRIFLGLNYEDYTREYGEIVKLLNFADDLLVVFEHGVALIPVNERAVAALSSGGDVYINTSKVLPETPNVISSTLGSMWADSVVLVPASVSGTGIMVFGVDTAAKKIWYYGGGNTLTVISDFKVQEFLNQNLTFTQRENTPLLGIRNVKTVYNAFKQDVMFTFYDDLNTTSEKVWNLCYNITLKQFTTFYSWVPSFMENINNTPFSFDRTISKWIAKLGESHANSSFALGITLSNNIYNNDYTTDSTPSVNIKYLTKSGLYSIYKWPGSGSTATLEYASLVADNKTAGLVGLLGIESNILPEGTNLQCYAEFQLLRDIYGYYKKFEIKKVIDISLPTDSMYNITIPVYGLFFNPEKDLITLALENIVSLEVEGSGGSTSSKFKVCDSNGNGFYVKDYEGTIQDALNKKKELYFSELYYRNLANRETNDYDEYKITRLDIDPQYCTINKKFVSKFNLLEFCEDPENVTDLVLTKDNYFLVMHKALFPVFHDRAGNRVPLPTNINKLNLVLILNVLANIYAKYTDDSSNLNDASLSEYLKYLKAKKAGTASTETPGWISAGTYSSAIAITSKWNFKFLNSSFWKHGQAGVFDITEDVLPTKWYGEQHPFEFEVVVNDNPGILKIFHNIEIISNKAKPESFHFEIVGESYDFAKDKVNMYFRQEARKALFQYNGCDIEYNSNFLKTNPKQQPKSAELVHTYYERLDTIEDVYDSYVGEAINDTSYSEMNSYKYGYDFWAAMAPDKDYRHLSGAEIVYYPTRLEYRVWQHLPAIDIDDLSLDTATSIIKANCQYLEDRWRVSINPLLITYKNEYVRSVPGALALPENSIWPNAMNSDYSKSETKLPPITLYNTSLPKALTKAGQVNFPDEINREGDENALYGLYSWEGNSPVDTTNWLNDLSIYKTSFGEALNRKEADLRDKFIKIRIRYSGEELAVIQFLNTIYSISYA